MNPATIHRSATAEQRILIEQAREEEFLAGIQFGIRLAAEMHERDGDHMAAQRLRGARLVNTEERTEG